MGGKDYIAVIQAGGRGTRMKDITRDLIPKPLLILNGKPMVQWQIENIFQFGVTEFILVIGYLGEKIKDYFEDGKQFGVHIRYIQETVPLGSAGALYYLKDMIETDNFLFIFGDVMFHLDWKRIVGFHEQSGGKVTLLAHPNSHPFDSDLLVLGKDNVVTEIDSKINERNYWYENCVNAGIYILSSQVLNQIAYPEKLDFEKDILSPMIEQKEVYGYRTSEYVKDAGTPDRFRRIEAEQMAGVWERKCLSQKQRCVFLDRDGTVNKYKGLIYQEDQLELEEYAAEAIRMLNTEGYLAIVITNQSVVARGLCNVEDVERIHKKMQVLLGREKAYLDDIVFCPHHPNKGFPEENEKYKVVCNCRKPATGMIEQMVSRYNIDLEHSYMVGDTTTDIQTGIQAGIRTILVLTGQAGTDGKYNRKPDYVADNLLDAVKLILKK